MVCVTRIADMTTMIKPYSELTVHGQARRLRALAISALGYYNLDVARIRLITNDFNAIFRLDTTAGEKFILRVTLPEGGHTKETIEAEAAWLNALSRETDLSVPQPVVAKNGQLAVEVGGQGVPEPRWCAIFRWVPGTDLAAHMNVENIIKHGSLMARLHQHAAGYQPADVIKIPTFNKVFPFPEPVILFDTAYQEIITPPRREVFAEAIEWAAQAIQLLQTSGEPMRLIHGDLHQWNVRLYHGVLSPIDFEDLMWGWPVQDIGTSLFYFFDAAYEKYYPPFKKGYCKVHDWPERYPGEVEAFIAARAVGLVNFILNDPNPTWRSQIPQFVQKIEERVRTLLEKKNR
jgi:Ser/Thr protein kinase RdoA (MazF antagonist)